MSTVTVADLLKTGTPQQAQKLAQSKQLQVPKLLAYSLKDLRKIVFPPRVTLVSRDEQPYFWSGQIIEVFAERGTGKTWLLLTLALLIAYAKSVMGFEVATPRKVLYVDGEMARDDIKSRLFLLAERLGINIHEGDLFENLLVIAADWQPDPIPRVDTLEMQKALEEHVQWADVVIIDNRSCLLDPEGEKDPSAWQPAGDYLLSLRRLGKTVIVAHHANRQGGARGIGKPEDAMDMVLKLTRPGDSPEAGAMFTVSCQPPDGKARGLWGKAAADFTVELTANGWMLTLPEGVADTVERKLRDYVKAADDAGEPAKSATAAISGAKVNKAKGLAAWAALLKNGDLLVYPTGGFHIKPVEQGKEPQF